MADSDGVQLMRAVDEYEHEYIRQTAGIWLRHGPLTPEELAAWRIVYVQHVRLNVPE